MRIEAIDLNGKQFDAMTLKPWQDAQ
jgi:hypothetical protein